MSLGEFEQRVGALGLQWDIGWRGRADKELRIWDWPFVIFRVTAHDKTANQLIAEAEVFLSSRTGNESKAVMDEC